ncbi:MAG: serine/threonine protein kinase [Planctomycetaceae bacterium]|nr:serine/threonine protein kinase [Planctomycetaceae bacterium]
MEVEYRTQQGHPREQADYVQRFPNHQDVIAHVFNAVVDEFRLPLANGDHRKNRKKDGGPTIIQSDSTDSQDHLDTERLNGENEFRRFLDPPTRPGWLGRIAHFEIESILGQGAFGIVAKAYDEKLHRVVAIKMLMPDLAMTSPPRQRFLREARAAAAMTHENIVAIYDTHEDPIPYLVMEFVPGPTLQKRMDETGPIEVAEVLRIGQQIASGLAAAHAVNLIHRDIKPSNILLASGPSDRVKISDFGLARAVDDASMTRSGMIAGTPMYMAPEQARGETLDHRADLFSLGSVLYQMASGRPPFRAINTIAVLKRVCEDTPRPLDDVIPETPSWLQSIIFRLLEKSREDRFQSAQEVADLLARCQRELEHSGKVISIAPSVSTASSDTPTIETKKSAWPKLLWTVLSTLVVLMATIIGPKLTRWFESPNLTIPETELIAEIEGYSRDEQPPNGKSSLISPPDVKNEDEVSIVFLEGDHRRNDRPNHGVEVHVDITGGEQIIKHATRMDFDFLKGNTLLDPYFAHGWYSNSDTEWSDFRAIHFQSDVNSTDPIWGVRTNRVNSLIGSVIIVTGSDDKNPFLVAKHDRVEFGPHGPRVRMSTNDHEDELGVANGSIYLSDRGYLELEWMGEKESLINSHKTYYLPAGTTLLDLGLRPGTSHTWKDDVFGTVTLLIQPEFEAAGIEFLR